MAPLYAPALAGVLGQGSAGARPRVGRWWSAPLALALVFALLVWPSAPLFGFQLALTALVGACVTRENNGLARPLQARPVSYIGRVSYGIYLLNSTAIGLVRRAFPEHTASSVFVLALSFPIAPGLAALSHRYLEAPFLRQSERFRAREPQCSSTKSA